MSLEQHTDTDDAPTTTTDAYRSILDGGEDATLRRQVAAQIATASGTTPDIAGRFEERSKNAIRPRVNELVRMGCVKREGTETTAAGNDAFIHHITSRGERYLRGEIDPDPKPPLSELATDVVDATRAFLSGGCGRDELEVAVQRHDAAKQHRNPNWQPPTVSVETDGDEEIPAELTKDEYEQIKADPVLEVSDVVNHE